MTNETNTYKQTKTNLGNIHHLDNNDLIGATLTAMMQ
jgi:hypothetical protein